MEDDAEAAGDRDDGAAEPTFARDLHAPRLKGAPSGQPDHHGLRGFEERGSHHAIAALRDAPGSIHLARLVLARGQAEVSADGFGLGRSARRWRRRSASGSSPRR
jgi:hypothetical protein